ncbi:EamA family transporter [Paeniglutamicibacter gangotriensis]|uniref:EamA family transporter n=1 Tax=Paeniglutamicibacter gangotriensis TaxID=254787 RepID=UPI003743A63C
MSWSPVQRIFGSGGLILAGMAFATEGPPETSWTPRFIIVLGFLGVVATAATTLAWFVEAQRSALSSLTVWMLLIPVFGLVIGIVVLGERPSAWTAAGLGLVMVAMWMALIKQRIAGSGPPSVLCVACQPDEAVRD